MNRRGSGEPNPLKRVAEERRLAPEERRRRYQIRTSNLIHLKAHPDGTCDCPICTGHKGYWEVD